MTTINNNIPEVPENVIDPAAAINVGFNWIDALLQLRVTSVGTNTPPGSPANGARYIVGPSPSGAWVGQANKLARYLDGGWQFFDAVTALNAADGNLYVRAVGTWAVVSTGGGSGEVNTGNNLGTGTGVYASKTGVTLNFKSLKVQTRLAIASDANEITFGVEAGYSIPPTAEQARWADAADWVENNSGKLREKLTAARTYYVRSDGNDANDGLTTGTAFLTVQKAIDVVAALDLGIFNATINVGAGTFASFICKDPVGAGSVTVSGVGATTIFSHSGTTGAAVSAQGQCNKYTISSAKIQAPNGTVCNGVLAGTGQLILVSNVTMGVCTGFHFNAAEGQININGTVTIDGDAQIHWLSSYRGQIVAAANVTLSGTRAFSQGFALASEQALIRTGAITFTGSATGKRYTVATLARINVNGAGASYFPGSIAGTADAASFGVYS